MAQFSQQPASLLLSKRAGRVRRLASLAGHVVLLLITCSSVFAVLFIFYFIGRDAFPFFRLEGFREFFTSTAWYPSHEPPSFGALSIFYGTAMVTVGSIIVAVPLGVLAALCLSDILPFSLRQAVKPVVEILAAIPSVAYGFFALVVFAPLLQDMHVTSGVNALNASIILGIMALPTIVSVSEDALQAVGRELREGSYAMGATRAETLVRVVIPAAGSGICAAVILGVMRAVGETMVVWMASGNAAHIPHPWYDFFASVRTLTATIAGEMGEADQSYGSSRFHALFAMALCLLVVAFILNLLSEWAVSRSRKKLRGE